MNTKVNVKNLSVKIAGLFLSFASVSSPIWAQSLTAETTLTIVNRPNVLFGSANIAGPAWSGDWPQSIDARLSPEGNPQPSGRELYIDNVRLTNSLIRWDSVPLLYPYTLANPALSTINAMITTVFSPDGANWTMITWDFLLRDTKDRHLEEGADSCWQGTVVNTLADHTAVRENIQERFRSNVYFTLLAGSSESTCATFSNQIQEFE